MYLARSSVFSLQIITIFMRSMEGKSCFNGLRAYGVLFQCLNDTFGTYGELHFLMPDCGSSKMLGPAEAMRQCGGHVVFHAASNIFKRSLELNQIYSRLRCFKTVSKGRLVIIKTSVYKTDLAPGEGCGHWTAAWQCRMAWRFIFK